jgi:transposase-like protein
MFAAEIRRKRVSQMRAYSNWQWHLDEVFVKINGETHYLWRAVDHEGEVLESFVTKRRERKAALKFLRKTMERHGRPHILVTDKLRSYGAAIMEIGNVIHTSHLDEESGPCFALVGCELYRNLSPSTPQSITTSTRSATSLGDQISS